MPSKWWELNDLQFIEELKHILIIKGLLTKDEIEDAITLKLSNAYPILDIDYQYKSQVLLDYLNTFNNMYLAGRSAQYKYLHVHELIRSSKEIIQKISN